MKIEKLFGEVVYTLRNFTNSINRNDKKQVDYIIEHLNSILHNLNYLQRNNDVEINKLEKRLVAECRKFFKNLTVKTNNNSVYETKLQRNIDYITWVNKQKTINMGSRKYTVAQKEIYYAYLGDNIGSEQNGRRPVVILQNDTGNTKGNTTVIAPVTTHQNKIRYDREKKKYYIEITKNNVLMKKYLDFYEIPLRLEGDENSLYGFVNIMHIRSIDRKRICGKCQGKTTKECFENIIDAINRNLS